MTAYGVECPECGDLRTIAAAGGLDEDGHRIRLRKCSNCDHNFTTLELAIDFNFYAFDTMKRKHRTYKGRVPMYELGHFKVWQVGETTSIRPTPGQARNLCRKGLHPLRGKNVYIRPNGQRVCNPCRRAAANALYRHRMDAARKRRQAA